MGELQNRRDHERDRAPSSSSPAVEQDPVELLKKRVFRIINRLGIPGLILFLGVLTWLRWDEVEKIPGVAWLVESVKELTPGPRATGTRFALALARLENDEKDEQLNNLLDALREHHGIELLVLPQTISVEGSSRPQEAVRLGDVRARALLKETHADVMIWGSVLRSGAKSVLSLHWTASAELEPKRSAGRYSPDEARDLDLPELFWTDMNDVLGMLVAAEQSKFSDQEGRAIADQLKPFIERVSALVHSPELTSDQKAALWENLGNSLRIYGEQQGDNASLQQSIGAYQEVLKQRTRERVPLDWAATQNNLGNAMFRLGERESGTAHLEQAVAAYQQALMERTRERVPLDWAATQNSLGLALAELGGREPGTAHLEQAVAAYQQALMEYTRERGPRNWAVTQNNLGVAFFRLGEREPGTAHLEQAVAAHQQALKELTRERIPLDWAMTQNNLGAALTDLGEREPGTAHLEQAVAAYQQALKEETRERGPLDWAATQNNLGNAMLTLGERESGTAHLEQAAAAYQQALMERTRERVPLDWAMTQSNLGNAMLTLGERVPGTVHLEQAVAAYQQALMERTRERVPLDWARMQNNLGNAFEHLGEREPGTAHLEQAVAAYQQALMEDTRERVPLGWAMTQSNLGNAMSRLGEREPGTVHLEQAVAAYQQALMEFTRERVPRDWAMTQKSLGAVLQTLGVRESGTAHPASGEGPHKTPNYLGDADRAYRASLEVFTKEAAPTIWGSVRWGLAEVRTAQSRLASAAEARRLMSEAADEYRAALEISPTNPSLLGELGDLLHEHAADFAAAYLVMAQLEEAQPNDGNRLNLAEAALTAGKFAECLATLGAIDITKLDPRYVTPRKVLLSACQWGANDRSGAATTVGLLEEPGDLSKSGWTTRGDRIYLAKARPFQAGRSDWIRMFEALQEGNATSLAESARSLSRRMGH
jgi:tetratricopeptide (TPR) repeat protein